MDQAVVLSTSRTPIGKSYRGSFNDTDSPTLASYSIKSCITKAGIDPSEVEDVIIGSAFVICWRTGCTYCFSNCLIYLPMVSIS